jgi:hypothetical protein
MSAQAQKNVNQDAKRIPNDMGLMSTTRQHEDACGQLVKEFTAGNGFLMFPVCWGQLPTKFPEEVLNLSSVQASKGLLPGIIDTSTGRKIERKVCICTHYHEYCINLCNSMYHVCYIVH